MISRTSDFAALEQDPSLWRLASLIYERCGIDYRDNMFSFAVKAGTRMKALGMTCYQYLGYVEHQPDEWDALIEAITINETYFFREEQQLEELVRVVLPALEGREEIRIWSAACSTGEEPYTLAMTILESGLVPLSRVHIYATDINRKVLQIAEQGFYPKHSMCFRRTPEPMKQRYFDAVPGGYRIKEEIRERVHFLQWNLIQDAADVLPVMDIIFCRNVLIYFDAQTIQEVISNLSGRLADGGYLFLGHAETITGMTNEFQTINAPATFYYRKEGGSL
jgi:chemotaxis protein methyltransferase CheR